ncbi:MAG TPA: hypothetical protein ENI90_06040 [Methylothermaceae bacterium]|nr:hypothetical protein [Methylothermaceae bacterium]
MRIDRSYQPLIPANTRGKAVAVAAVEPIAADFRNDRENTAAYVKSKVVMEDGPLDRRVRQALEAYLNHQGIRDEPMTLLQGIDIYV